MITVIKDNTINTYYTICKKCNSEFSYNYTDVEFEGNIFITNRTVKCPVCEFKTSAELKCKNEGYSINGKIYVHHLNPLTKQMILDRDPLVFDLENLVCVSFNT